jgi:hypothetical protein
VLLRNDWWCKGLGQSQPKSDAYVEFKRIRAERKDAAKQTAQQVLLAEFGT